MTTTDEIVARALQFSPADQVGAFLLALLVLGYVFYVVGKQ